MIKLLQHQLSPISSIAGVNDNLNYAEKVARGLVPGVSNVQIGSQTSDINSTIIDIWDFNSVLDYPTSGEQWEVVSSDAADTAAGIGARSVLVTYLDVNYIEQTEIVATAGLTPVSLVASNAFRPRSIQAIGHGSAGVNIGKVTLREIGTNSPMCGISVVNGIGLNVSFNSHYTVPSGFGFMPLNVSANTIKNEEIELTLLFRLAGIDGFTSLGSNATYQNTFKSDLENAPVVFPEKTDFKFMAISTNPSTKANTQFSGRKIKNS